MGISEESIGSYLLAAAIRHPQRIMVKQPEIGLTYAEVAVTLASTILRLREDGIHRGDHVACYLEDQLPSLYFELACALSGVVVVPLSPLFSVDYFVKGIVERIGAKLVLTTPDRAASLGGRGLRLCAYPDARTPAPVDGLEVLADLPIGYDRAVEVLQASSAGIVGDDTFMIQPTSGTTGEPKLVLRRHRAFTRYAHFVGEQVAVSEPDPTRFLMVATLTHAFGLHMLATALRQQATLCIPSGLDTAASLDQIRGLDPIVLPLLPRMQRALMRQHLSQPSPPEQIFGPSARFICSAGGTPDAELLATIQRTGVDIIEFYGSSEASIVAVTPRGEWRPGWAGRIPPDVEVKVGDDGELAVRSPGVTTGYVGDAAGTSAVFDLEGYYCSGDVGEVDGDRWLRIVGRKRDVFNTPEGSNIYPGRVEQRLEALPDVEQAVLVGDQRPYLIALLVVSGMPAGDHGDARILDPARHAELYSEIGHALKDVNDTLERVEKIIRFALLYEPFPAEAYRAVGPGKIRRDRAAVDRLYGDVIRQLYVSLSIPDLSYVPSIERRLRAATPRV